MKLDLYALRKARILSISLPGQWVTTQRLSGLYNNKYGQGVMTRMLKKTIMHPVRMERILQRMVGEGYYQQDSEKGYKFLTKKPKKY